MVWLTATLPPSEEGRLFERMHFPPSSVLMFRARTSRRNVAYRIWRPSMDQYQRKQWIEMPHVVEWIRDRIRRHQPSKVIVHAQTVSKVQIMAELLGYEAYFHDQVNKAGILQRFRSGQCKAIVATSALGMGIDMPDIRSIIHLGRPRTMLDYGQESGRVGRDVQSSEAVMIISEPEPDAPWDPKKATSVVDQALVQRYIDVGSEMDPERAPRC